MDDCEMLQVQNRNLERENRSLRRNLRDEMAMAALTGYLANPNFIYDPYCGRVVAKNCYNLADEMMEAGKK